jgi:hypothetical protein
VLLLDNRKKKSNVFQNYRFPYFLLVNRTFTNIQTVLGVVDQQ